ncbi:MAG: MarR family transcriptional regulator [Acidipropionibacterium acidipropionici]|jgi:DNA-binding MarR family transcriptional regulator|nr:MarR family transcriptional regulator [Acidipropionibacterium acidipropionici]AZP39513.1 MarR family transcriptional regulator [Acidipropionibacterium acidipropionici]MDN6557561.1 MarR family transcriptional regulator [Acidipropionibacterium acidipropionici]
MEIQEAGSAPDPDEAGPGRERSELANDLRLACQMIARRVRFESSSKVPPHQMSVLFKIRREPRTPGALAEAERISAPAMTRTVNAMAEAGLVRRMKHPEDSRSVLVVLTDEGRRTIEEVLDSRDTWMARHLDGLAEEDLDLLERATKVLTRIGQQ